MVRAAANRGLGQLVRVNDDCLVLTGAFWGLAHSAKGAGNPATRGPAGEGKPQGLGELWQGEDPCRPPGLYTTKNVQRGGKTPSVARFRPNCISKALFSLHSKTYFSKQVLCIGWNVKTSFLKNWFSGKPNC